MKIEQELVSKIISWGCILTLLAVTPWSTLDPINVPKFAILVMTAGVCFALLIKNFRLIARMRNSALLVTSGTFIIFLFISFFSSKIDFKTQLFGVNGRNTGLITYFSLLILLLSAATLTNKGFEKRLIHTLITAGALSTSYGVIQHFNLDPASWVNPYSPVIGFLGNPDFQSSFLGISAVAILALLLGQISIQWKLFGIGFIAIILFVISSSDAQQGFLVFLTGAFFIVGQCLFYSSWKKVTPVYLVAGVFGFIGIIAGSLNRGPLASILHKESVVYRGDYWRAGWKITVQHPLTGVGLDGYGDWYRRARNLAATVRRGPDVTSNAAHNVWLDLSSNGGFPLLISYLTLVILVVIASLRILKSSKVFDPYFSALFGCWIAYHAQSIISLNQIGLAIWGWVLGGAIIGYSFYKDENLKNKSHANKRTLTAADIALRKISPAAILAVFMGVILGAICGLPPYLSSAKYRDAMETGNITTITQAAYIWPLDVSRLGQVAATLRDNNFNNEALTLILKATQRFPDSYEAWKILASLPSASPEQVSQAKDEMKRLDPQNPELK